MARRMMAIALKNMADWLAGNPFTPFFAINCPIIANNVRLNCAVLSASVVRPVGNTNNEAPRHWPNLALSKERSISSGAAGAKK